MAYVDKAEMPQGEDTREHGLCDVCNCGRKLFEIGSGRVCLNCIRAAHESGITLYKYPDYKLQPGLCHSCGLSPTVPKLSTHTLSALSYNFIGEKICRGCVSRFKQMGIIKESFLKNNVSKQRYEDFLGGRLGAKEGEAILLSSRDSITPTVLRFAKRTATRGDSIVCEVSYGVTFNAARQTFVVILKKNSSEPLAIMFNTGDRQPFAANLMIGQFILGQDTPLYSSQRVADYTSEDTEFAPFSYNKTYRVWSTGLVDKSVIRSAAAYDADFRFTYRREPLTQTNPAREIVLQKEKKNPLIPGMILAIKQGESSLRGMNYFIYLGTDDNGEQAFIGSKPLDSFSLSAMQDKHLGTSRLIEISETFQVPSFFRLDKTGLSKVFQTNIVSLGALLSNAAEKSRM